MMIVSLLNLGRERRCRDVQELAAGVRARPDKAFWRDQVGGQRRRCCCKNRPRGIRRCLFISIAPLGMGAVSGPTTRSRPAWQATRRQRFAPGVFIRRERRSPFGSADRPRASAMSPTPATSRLSGPPRRAAWGGFMSSSGASLGSRFARAMALDAPLVAALSGLATMSLSDVTWRSLRLVVAWPLR